MASWNEVLRVLAEDVLQNAMASAEDLFSELLRPPTSPATSLLFNVLESLPLGVVVLDEAGRVVLYNEYEQRLARRTREQVIGRDFFEDVAQCMNVAELGHRFRADIGSTPIDVRTDFAFDFPFMDQPRDVIVQMKTLAVDHKPYCCVFIEDVTARRTVERMRATLSDLVVHDLKNPLAAILANIEFARGSTALRDDSEALEALGDAHLSGRRLDRMLINLLDLTRLSTGTFPLKRRPTDLRALLDNIASESAMVARQRHQTLAVEGERIVVSADVEVLRRAVDNLLENALRHAPDGTRVTLRATATEQHFALEVADEGPGLREEQRVQIFERFQTSSGASHNRGLGLYFVQLAARAHGGEASVECPGVGCVFGINGQRAHIGT